MPRCPTCAGDLLPGMIVDETMTAADADNLADILDEVYVELATVQDQLPVATWEAVKRIMGRT